MSRSTATHSTPQHHTRMNAEQPLTQPQSALETRHGVTSERVSSGSANGCGLRVAPRRPLDHQTSQLGPEELGSCGLRATASAVHGPPTTVAADRQPTEEALRTAPSGYFRWDRGDWEG